MQFITNNRNPWKSEVIGRCGGGGKKEKKNKKKKI